MNAFAPPALPILLLVQCQTTEVAALQMEELGSMSQLALNINAPVCGPAPAARENNLGNPIGGGKSASSYNWTIPYNVASGAFLFFKKNEKAHTHSPPTLPGSQWPRTSAIQCFHR